MSNIYNMSGKKVVLKDDIPNVSYKKIMTTIIKYATEEGCHRIFCNGGVNMCPSDVFGEERIDKEKEEYDCNFESIGCTKCWTNAINLLEKEVGVADEMFEKLEYKDMTTEFVGVKEKYITYGNKEDDFIIFYLESKNFGIFSEKQDNLNCKCASLDMQELQAINEKCKELGWIE